MKNATRSLAEFGNDKGDARGARIIVEIGNGAKLVGSDRTIKYKVSGSADRGDGKDYTIDGCTSSTCSVKLPANRHSAVITIYVNDDGLVEPDETIVFTLEDDSGYTVNQSKKKTTVTIRDDDTRGLMFHRTWPDVKEGGSETHTLRLRSQPTAAVTVKIASDNPDVTVSPSSLTFNPSGNNLWDRNQTVTISAAQDRDAVDDTATLTYTTSGGDYGGAKALSIERPVSVDDDDKGTTTPPPPTTPTASFASGSSSAAESAGTHNVRVNLSPAAPSGGLTLGYSVSGTATAGSGNDFTIQNSGTLSVGTGATTVNIPVAINDDSANESAETVILTLTGGTGYTLGGTRVHRLTITDNDSPPGTPAVEFASASSSAAENAGTRNVTVNLSSAAPSGGLTLSYSVTGTATAGSGNDFTIQNSGTVTVTAGAASATIPVAINDDSANESAERVILTLTDGTGYTLGSRTVHTLTITDNDGGPVQPVASFASASSSAAESTGTYNVTVNLSSAAPSGGLALDYSVSGTATAGSGNDFTIQNSGTLTVAAGDTSATIPVAINDDSSTESAETVILTLTGGTGYTLGSPGAHTLTITDNDGTGQPAVSFASTSSSAAESAGTRNVRVNLSAAAPSGGLTLRYSVTGTATAGSGNDFTIAGSGSLSVAARATFATIPVAINDDSSTESAETVILTLTGGTGYTLGSTTVYTLTITDNDDVPPPPPPPPPPGTPGLMISKNTLSVSEGGTGSYTVQLATAPTGMVTVAIASTNADVTVSPAPLTFHASGSSKRWDTAQTVTVSARQDSDAVDDTATLTHTTGGVKAASVTVAVDDDETLGGARTAATVAKDNPPRADPAAWLARFGRMVAGQALGGITGRMAAARRAGFAGSIGRRAIGFGSQTPGSQARPGPGLTTGAGGTGAAPESADVFEGGGPVNAARLSPGSLSGAGLSLSDIDRMFGTGRAAGASRTLTGRDLMLGSRFTLTGERDATGGSLAFWGQAAQSGFDGREGRVSLDGKAVTAMLGADYARDRWLAGMALMQSGGKGDSRDMNAGAGSGSGDVETTLTAALPYASLQVSERMKLWGALGHGTGEVTLKPEPGRTLKSDISWTMAATGLRSEVIPPPEEGSGPALALVSDALWAGTSSDKAHELAASDSDVTRLRLGLEGSWTMALQEGGHPGSGSGASLTPKLEAGLRHDDGDAETGFGVELGGGLAWVDPRLGLSLDLSGRMLVTHGADDLEDRGFAASLAFDPDPSTERGLSLALRQERGGQATGGLDALFRADPLRARTGSEKDTRWTAEAAWGFAALDRRFTGSPHVGLGIATGARDYTLGWRLTPEAGAPDLGFGVTATRRESDEAAPQHGIGVELNTRW